MSVVCKQLAILDEAHVSTLNRSVSFYKNCIFTHGINKKDNKLYVYQYDINQNEWMKLSKFPATLNIDCHHSFQACDEITGNIYIIGSYNNNQNKGAIFNINTQIWNILNVTKANIIKSSLIPSCYIASPINKLHFVSSPLRHYRFDEKPTKSKIIKCSNMQIQRALFYVKSLKKLFSITRFYTHYHIISCDIKEKQKKYEWKKHDKLKWEWEQWGYVLAFHHLLFIFNYQSSNIMNCGKDMYCIDLLTENIYNYHVNINSIIRETRPHQIIKTEDNYVHFFKTRNVENYRIDQHFKMYLYEILPKELSYLANNPLTFGYVKKLEMKYDFNVPFYLTQIIATYL